MDQAQIQQLMAQYLQMMGQGQQDPYPQMVAQQQGMQALQQPMQGIQMGGFRNPQMPQGGMGSMQGGRGF